MKDKKEEAIYLLRKEIHYMSLINYTKENKLMKKNKNKSKRVI